MESTAHDAIALLRLDHAECVRHIARLETASDSIRLRGFSAIEFGNIVEAVEYIDTTIRTHQETEERYLVPLLERHAPELCTRIRDEHKHLWSAFGKLLRSVRDIQDGRIYGTSINELTSTATIMAKLLHTCINDEETILFPAMKRLLTPNEYGQLTKDIERASIHNQ